MRGKREPALFYWLRQCVGFREPVDRRTYAVTGGGLMVLKYVVEWLALASMADAVYSPLDFLNPLISARAQMANSAPEWLGIMWVVWTLPFLWVALSMSFRRADDAGLSPWIGFFVLVPVFNLLVMIGLSLVRTADRSYEAIEREIMKEIKEIEEVEEAESGSNGLAMVNSILGGIGIGALYASVMIQISVYGLESYGATLFFGTPVATGAAAAYLLNMRCRRSIGASVGVALASVFLASLGLLLFALEGVICIVMAAPIMLPMALVGGLIGKAIADRRRNVVRGLAACLLVLPGMAAVESRVADRSEFVVLSSVDIDAPAERVWQTVIDFPPIDAPLEWYFRLGIAAPESARLVGSGVEATRHCNFTTGSFVEPITAWDPPRRLAFDVRTDAVPAHPPAPPGRRVSQHARRVSARGTPGRPHPAGGPHVVSARNLPARVLDRVDRLDRAPDSLTRAAAHRAVGGGMTYRRR
jgi:uncharacterized membrane protein YhaH (DUF805 family)